MISQLANQDTPLMPGFIKVNILCLGVSKNISGRAVCERASTDKDFSAHFNFPEFFTILDSVYERKHTMCSVSDLLNLTRWAL